MTDKGGGPRAKPAGLRDVAALAGVSMGTVSNVLNRPETVRLRNREKVERAIRELNFVGSHAAIQLRSGRSHLVGVVVPDVGNPFWGDVIRGIESVTDEADIFLIVSSTRQEAARERSILDSFLTRSLDGLLFTPVDDESESIEKLASRGIRVITFERSLQRDGIPTVHGNNIEGGEAAARHLLDLGHERIVLVNGPDFISWSHERRLGTLRALESRNLSPGSLQEVIVPDLTAAHGESAVERVIELLPHGGAIMCANDLVALGVLRGLSAHGHRVPDDYSLIGYDDVDFAAALSPALTTVRQPSFDMGAIAARMLLGEGREEGDSDVAFPPQLIVRDSTAPPHERRAVHRPGPDGRDPSR